MADGVLASNATQLVASAPVSSFHSPTIHRRGQPQAASGRSRHGCHDSCQRWATGEHITTSELTVVGVVPGLDQAKFAELADGAKDGCPISQALKGNVELSVVATLAG